MIAVVFSHSLGVYRLRRVSRRDHAKVGEGRSGKEFEMQPGAYWIVEVDGRVTVGLCMKGFGANDDATSWKIIHDAPARTIRLSDPGFRAFRWVDIKGLADQLAPARGSEPDTIDGLRRRLAQAKKIIWLLATQAGGTIDIAAEAVRSFAPHRAAITILSPDPTSDDIRIEAGRE